MKDCVYIFAYEKYKPFISLITCSWILKETEAYNSVCSVLLSADSDLAVLKYAITIFLYRAYRNVLSPYSGPFNLLYSE